MLSKCVLVAFVLFQCLQFIIPVANANSNATALVRNTRASRLQRQMRYGYSGLKKIQHRCQSNPKKCRNKPNFRVKNPFRYRKKDKRCCRKLNKLCQRKLRKRCKKRKCFIKQSRKCQKQFSRCNRRKSTNRRPGNCGPGRERRPNKNQRPRPSSMPPRTTTKPKIKKRNNERCSKSDECAKGLCCARHQRLRICKPLIQKDQVCTREYKSIKRSPEMYERCPCDEGLTCSPSASETRHYTCQITT